MISYSKLKGDGKDYYVVRARIAQLDRNFKMAESIYLENHSINEAIEMYQNIYKWDEAIDVAEAKVGILPIIIYKIY